MDFTRAVASARTNYLRAIDFTQYGRRKGPEIPVRHRIDDRERAFLDVKQQLCPIIIIETIAPVY